MEQVTTQKDRYFRGQGPEEHVLAFCRKHWITLVPHFLLFGIMTTGTVLFALNHAMFQSLYETDFFMFLIFFVGFMMLYYVHHFFQLMFRYNLSVLIVTDSRVISLHKSLYLVNDKEMADLKNIQEVKNLQSGVLQNLFNFGDLNIVLSTTGDGVYLHSIPNPDFHFRLINNARQAYVSRLQGGLQEMGTMQGTDDGTEGQAVGSGLQTYMPHRKSTHLQRKMSWWEA